MLRTASSLPLAGLLTLGFDPTRFQMKPPACYRATWQLPEPDSHRQATTSLRTANHLQRQPPAPLDARRVGGWRGDAVAFRFQSPPVEPCVRFSRTRLTDALHRRCSVSPARPGGAWVQRRFR